MIIGDLKYSNKRANVYIWWRIGNGLGFQDSITINEIFF